MSLVLMWYYVYLLFALTCMYNKNEPKTVFNVRRGGETNYFPKGGGGGITYNVIINPWTSV